MNSRKAARSGKQVPVQLSLEVLEDRTVLSANSPWFPSLMAFEHYDSGRTHLFEQASFGGWYGNNEVNYRRATTTYPAGYNIVYKSPDEIFLYGGGYGNVDNVIGPYVAKVDPVTLESMWHTQLIVTAETGETADTQEWNYPGVAGILEDGFIYVIYGYRLSKINPVNGHVIQTLVLPTGEALPQNTSYNGFNALQDGTIIAKTIYREEGCTAQGSDALYGGDCDPLNVPPSIMVSINPETMKVLDQIELPGTAAGRITATRFRGKDYVYLTTDTTALRYLVVDGKFTLDESWVPGDIYLPGQSVISAVGVMNDWIAMQTNGAQAKVPLSVIVINQADATHQDNVRPFFGIPVPREYPRSLAPMSVSVDPVHNLVYSADASPGAIGILKLTGDSLQSGRIIEQRTLEFLTLIGPPGQRVLATSKLPDDEPLGTNKTNFVVWRDAQTGRELASTRQLPAMSSGAMVQPYYFGKMFYLGREGALIELSVRPNPGQDSGKTLRGAALAINVLSNDSDTAGTLDPTTVAVMASPSNGLVAVNPINGVITYTPNATFIGTDTFTYTVKDNFGTPSGPATVTVQVFDRSQAANGGLIATGVDAGGGSNIRVFDPVTGEERFNFPAYQEGFTGGVRVAIGDITGDNIPDLVTGPGPGGGPHVRIFDGVSFAEVRGFFAYDQAFAGGVFVTVGDFNGDNQADVITGADAGGGPHIKVFSGRDGSVLASFFAFDPSFSGGVRVEIADVNGDLRPDLIAAAGPGGGAHVRVFDGITQAEIRSFFAYDQGFIGGVFVTVGDINGDNHDDIITGAGPGGGLHVRVFDGQSQGELAGFMTLGLPELGGVRVTASDVNGDGRDEIIATPGVNGEEVVKIFDGLTATEVDRSFANSTLFRGGAFLGSGR